nr:probable E3 ubiquitin-protein ligase RHG1A isoform X2 [Quercus suber]POE74021.1 putative e3 ubiquitin-protein ligase rhg1a [Quercus suber]
MQGQRGRIGSLTETLEFDHGSTSSNAAIEQQICWNNMRNPAGNLMPDCILSPSDMNITYLNSMNPERPMSSGWSLGEPSSGNTQSEVSHEERKAELGWPSSGSGCAGAGSRLEEQSCEPTHIFSVENVNMNPLFLQSSNSDVPQNLNLNTGFVGNGDDNSQVLECPNMHKSSGSENQWIPPSSGSDNHVLHSRSGGFLVEQNDGRQGCSMEGRRVSCKRKALDGTVGQSSVSGSPSYFQRAENSAWSAVPARFNGSSSLGVSAPSEPVNPRLRLGARDIASDSIPDLRVAGSSQRNSRARITPPNQQDSIAPTLFPTESAVRHSSISSSQLPPRLLPVDYSLDLRSAPAADNMIPHSQPVFIHVPALPRNVQAFRWNGGSSSGIGSSSSAVVSGDRDAGPREEMGSRSMSRNLLENPMFVPATEVRNFVRNPANRSSTGVNLSIPGNIASTSRTGGPSSGVHPLSAPTLVPQQNPPQFPRRLSDYVRRSLSSSAGSESGGNSSNYSLLRSGPPVSSQEMVFSSGPGSQGHHQSHPRSALWMERHGDAGLGIPYLLRGSAAAGEGSGRLVSEIRNVLGLMRRGENLRFEDVMILDQSVFFGVADIHDRHRDMRLDVDNMSYEELLALEERIGNVSTGLSEETILNHLRQRKYSIAKGSPLEGEPCCVCQEEYKDGDNLGTLECGHDFHTDCIKQWLTHKNLCPICKTTALAKRDDH